MKKYRQAIFAVVYAITNGKVEYAILKRKKHWVGWEFTKGKIEKFETKRMAARREAKEETGLKILKTKKFHISGSYKYKIKLKDRPGFIGQTYHLFAVKVKKGKIKVDRKEHSYGKWMSFKEAMKKLSWGDQRRSLKIVNDCVKYEIPRVCN
ncbi:RNA pyrophosphohydrolase [uncultured archaeon]|nr:RNA pyrophosphohydrolase [uncultured archaeon]